MEYVWNVFDSMKNLWVCYDSELGAKSWINARNDREHHGFWVESRVVWNHLDISPRVQNKLNKNEKLADILVLKV